MTCQHAREQLPDYLAGCLSGAARRHLEQHLSECAGCRSERVLHDRVMALVTSCQDAEPPPGLWNGVRERIRRPEPRGAALQRWFLSTFSKPVNAASGIAATAALLAMLLSTSPSKPGGVWQQPEPMPENASAAGFLQQQTLMDAREPLADRVALGPVVTIAVREDRAHDLSEEGNP